MDEDLRQMEEKCRIVLRRISWRIQYQEKKNERKSFP